MKIRLFAILLAAILSVPAMAGCQAADAVESVGRAVERSVETVGDRLKGTSQPTAAASAKPSNPALTAQEAQDIALKHAGFTADQVTALRTEYEVEYGVPQYEVEFRRGAWEYDYEIHANTGEILSYSKDD